ncbi:hypothetical protein LVQ79_10700 [Buttiauxella sp. A2-C1_F]|uniref:hypothetical protein n=1 Tax=Buttiauxella sp. A2-C1_F TaxID=2904526 RepID=UPI001E51EDAF|nr:hypothetical protein [Buttiauxella sp. A2-C1_F]MCE0846014.1 hypothetical protein [Buttiauxella sp. A2-C1_F]
MKIKFEGSTAHFAKDMHPSHGPQTWPWWRLFSVSVVRLGISPPSIGRRVWFYTRWGAGFVGVYFDRRKA